VHDVVVGLESPRRREVRPVLLTELATVDEVLRPHAAAVGRDFTAYRNHVYRVVNLCMAQRRLDPDQLEKVAVAAAFHDLGIWTDGTFDYLPPSIRLAREWLGQSGKAEWAPEISEMIREHHKLSPFRRDRHGLVELFRRADWVDVSRGLITFGVPRTLLREILSTWPSAGFRKRLLELGLTRLRTHPWSPLPMVKL
jgi:hypothetical protein